MKKALNIGCGSHSAPGWTNLDNSPNARLAKIPYARTILYKAGILSEAHYKVDWPDNLIIQDLDKKLPFKDNELQYVFSSHCLEHLSFNNAIQVLEEIKRVLAPGGIVRIVLPDLKFYIDKYMKEKEEGVRLAADNFIKNLHIISKARDPHLWMYDLQSITKRLEDLNFRNITECTFKKGDCIDVEILDNRPNDSLFVEAMK